MPREPKTAGEAQAPVAEAPRKRGRKPKAQAQEVAPAPAPEVAPGPEKPAALDGAKLARLVELEKQRKELEAMLEAIKTERASLEKDLLSQFEATGTSSVKAQGVTIYLRRDVWAKLAEGVERGQAVAALKAAGLDELVSENFNTNTLSSYLRELEKNGDPMPEAFTGVIETSEVFSLRTTGAK